MPSLHSPLSQLSARLLVAALVFASLPAELLAARELPPRLLTSLPVPATASGRLDPLHGPIHADGIGSIRRLTDEAGNITDGYTYTAFGELLAHTGSDQQPYAFAGEPLDPNSGWQYHRARWLDPGVGRFVSLDPLLGALSLTESEDPDLIGLRPYLYVQSDPANRVDPSGLAEFTLVGITITITNQNTVRAQNTVHATAARSTILRQLGSVPVRNVNGMRAIRQAGQQTHHLIERRIYERIPQLKKIWPRHDQMPGVNLSPAQHQQFTNLWRQFFPYRNQAGHIANPTLDHVIKGAETIYKGHSELYKAIFVDLLLLL